jgi:hypothetical protein
MAIVENAQIISVKDLPNGSERLIQDMIANNPSILTLGKLEFIQRERRQPSGGRLDILLQDASGESWYEVEIQLGATDETHIIRTIEYWEREQRQYPEFQHTAVIVAEEINGRYFNVISLFKRQMPIIAVKIVAFKVGDRFGVLFTKILDFEPRAEEAADAIVQPADRAYWETRSSEATIKAMDEILQIARESNPKIELKYNKGYIGTTVDGTISNFLTFGPKKRVLNLGAYLPSTPDNDKLCEEAGFEVNYDPRYSKYRFAVLPEDVEKRTAFFRGFIRRSYEEGA